MSKLDKIKEAIELIRDNPWLIEDLTDADAMLQVADLLETTANVMLEVDVNFDDYLESWENDDD